MKSILWAVCLIIKCVRSILLSPWWILTHHYHKSVEPRYHNRGITEWACYEAQSIIVDFPYGLLRVGLGKQFEKKQYLKKRGFGHGKWMRNRRKKS